jgi:hypothetical protein
MIASWLSCAASAEAAPRLEPCELEALAGSPERLNRKLQQGPYTNAGVPSKFARALHHEGHS